MSNEPRRADTRPEIVTQSRGIVGTAIQVVMLLLLLCILAGVVLMLLTVASLVGVPAQVAGGVGARLNGAASEASRAVSGAQQALQNVTDPAHPPIGLTYDNEFSGLPVWHVNDGLPGGTTYVLSVQSIQRRNGADSADTALFAVLHAELRQPHETRILGQLLRTDRDPHDYFVYKGEVFRIGTAVYRVNWISQTESALAAGILRHPDLTTAALKFEYD